jgi:hypothetical protein
MVDLSRYVSNPIETTPMKFKWGWCEVCDTTFVYCPKCGNNCCNAGFGQVDGKVCDVCNLAYQYQHLAWATNTAPKKEEIDEKNVIDEEKRIEKLLGDKNENSTTTSV